MRWVAVVVVVAACGRIGFDAPGTDPGGPVDAPPQQHTDRPGFPGLCGSMPCAGTSRSVSCGGACFATCEEAVDQPTARARCQAWGGDLAVLHDAADDTCLATIQEGDLWIGFVQAAGTTELDQGWSWLDGSPVTYVNWTAGEPNDGDGVESGEEQCAIRYLADPWNDYYCGQNKTFACSK